MGRIEDHYLKLDAEIASKQNLSEAEKIKQALEEYNKNIDIINEVTNEIKNVMEVKLPIPYTWLSIWDESSKKENRYVGWCVSWSRPPNESSKKYSTLLLSNGHLYFLAEEEYMAVKSRRLDVNRANSLNSRDSLINSSVRKDLIRLATEKFGIEAKSNWSINTDTSHIPKPIPKDDWRKYITGKSSEGMFGKILFEILDELREANNKPPKYGELYSDQG